MTSFRRRTAAWLGALAIALHGLLPVDAMPRPASLDLSSGICTSEGFKPAGGNTQTPRPLTPAHDHAQCAHCAPCTFSVAVGPPSSIGLLQAPALRGDAHVNSTQATARSPRSWNPSARPRAPPSLPAVS